MFKKNVKERLMLGIRRLNRIIKSTQTYGIEELLMQAKLKAQQKHDFRENMRKSNILKRAPINDSQRNEKTLLMLHVKMDNMSDVIETQK